jgi:hypothetical protein
MVEALAFLKPHRASTRRRLTLLLLVIMPFPIGLPLAFWLTRRDGSTQNAICMEAMPTLTSLRTPTTQSLQAA